MIRWLKRAFRKKTKDCVAHYSQAQAGWQLICICGAFDLFSKYLETNSCSESEGDWIQTQLNQFYNDLGALKESGTLEPSFQSIADLFYQHMISLSNYREAWSALLIDPKCFGGNSFGKWLQVNGTALDWKKNEKLTQEEKRAVSFYTVLFFADLESLFIGPTSYVESYWSFAVDAQVINMASISAELLVSYYYQQAGPTKYREVLGYLNDVLNYRNFAYGPYDQNYNSCYATFLDQNFQTFWKETNIPAAIDICVERQEALFSSYADPKTQSTCIPLSQFGSYLDGSAAVCRQILLLQKIMNQLIETAEVAICTEKAVPICTSTQIPGKNPAKDSLATIVNNPNSIDTTSPYWAFYRSAAWNLPRGNSCHAVDFRNSVDLKNYAVMFLLPDPFGSNTPVVQAGESGNGYSLFGYTPPLLNLTIPLAEDPVTRIWGVNTSPDLLSCDSLFPSSGTVVHQGQAYEVSLSCDWMQGNNKITIEAVGTLPPPIHVEQFPGVAVAWSPNTVAAIRSLNTLCDLYLFGEVRGKNKEKAA